jgi:hypothetical protein
MGPARISTPFFITDVGMPSIPSAFVLFWPFIVFEIFFALEKLKEKIGT